MGQFIQLLASSGFGTPPSHCFPQSTSHTQDDCCHLTITTLSIRRESVSASVYVSKDRFSRVLPPNSIGLNCTGSPGLTFRYRGTKETVLSAARILSLPWLGGGQTDPD